MALVWPPFTVALEGTVRFALLLEIETTDPPTCAGEVKETVHCVLPGVFTVVGEQASPLNAGTGGTETAPGTPVSRNRIGLGCCRDHSDDLNGYREQRGI